MHFMSNHGQTYPRPQAPPKTRTYYSFFINFFYLLFSNNSRFFFDSQNYASIIDQGLPKRLLKEGGGHDSLENTPTSNSVSLALVMYTCSEFAMPLLSCVCLYNNNKLCLPSFVSSYSNKVLLL